ncbi:MAG: BMP family ABC transporter substrate-binding protein [Spirochaetales bacterium]|nr:BMP family ABC transporter substrate-binding protein [Spirochaetales bacterium]
MKRIMPAFLAVASICIPALAQPFLMTELVTYSDLLLPAPVLREPFPWGCEPAIFELSGVGPGAAAVRVVETDLRPATGSEIARAPTRVFEAGAVEGTWAEDGRTSIWVDGDTRFWWDSASGDGALVACTGPWTDPEYVLRISGASGLTETWTRDPASPARWLYESNRGERLAWIRSSSVDRVDWTAYDKSGKGVSRLTVRSSGGQAVSVEWWPEPGTRTLLVTKDSSGPGTVITGTDGGIAELRMEFDEECRPLLGVIDLGATVYVDCYSRGSDERVRRIETEAGGLRRRVDLGYGPEGFVVRLDYAVLVEESGETRAEPTMRIERFVEASVPGGARRELGPDPAALVLLSLRDAKGAESADDGFYIGLVTDEGGIHDGAFNQGAWEGVQALARDARPGETLSVVYLPSSAEAFCRSNLDYFAEREADLIVGAGFFFNDALGEIAERYPDRNFLLFDGITRDADGELYPNVACALFAEHEGSFLAGVAAGLAAKAAGKDTLGFIGPKRHPLFEKYQAGFEQGVRAVLPEAVILVDYSGTILDAAKDRDLTRKQYDAGAYIIFHSMATGNGLIEEAKARRERGEAVWALGVEFDQYDAGRYGGAAASVVLTSMVKRVDVAAREVAKMTMDGNFPGGEVLVFGAASGGVGLPDENPNLDPSIIVAVREWAGRIASGELVVSETP